MMQREDRQQRGNNSYHTSRRFADRGQDGWIGPLVDYKEFELLRKFLTSSSKLMSRKRAGTNTQEQRALRIAVKRARFLSLIPYTSS
jgi:small subunit ribosomal protein S18